MTPRSVLSGVAAVTLLGSGLIPASAAPVLEDVTSTGLTAYVGTVTLITGDRVVVRRTGGQLLPQMEPAPGRENVQFATASDGKRLMVVPSDAQAGISTGRVDGRLFDVAGLIEDGYGDDRKRQLPLLMPDTRAALKAGATTAVATAGLSAVEQPKARTKDLWAALRGSGKVWLDGLRKPTLDRSTVQIGAPVAWQAGYTGQGVTIAVLDTGIDSGHPDFRGRIAAVKNFTDESGTKDQVGHGTHVASTVAGSGAASDGKYKGVAPDAKLLVGKVCAVYGCPESAILAGMEWAAKSGAKAVNLSLGGPDTPGIDPLEQAVQDLSATYKTLFVIAAGNDGRDGTETVGSPASADAALAVGAVDRDDAIADFSSRGPRIRDAALKPEIVAPGTEIVAARAGGGYTSMSGTSMATPHVTGSAAILAGQHPDWTGAQLKAALVGSAKPVNADVFEQGAGRVDIGRAVGQTVTAEPATVSIGRQAWPHEDDPVVTRSITYRNPASTAQTLTLATGTSAPEGMFTLSAPSVTVPASGQASVTVTVDTRVPADEGTFGAWITASGVNTRVVTPVAVDREPESYDLTVRTVDSSGARTENQVSFIWGTDLDLFRYFRGSGGEATLRVRRGVYHLDATVASPRAGGGYDSAKITRPSVDVTADTTITFDARDAKPLDVRFGRPGLVQRLAGVGYSRYRGERGLITGVLGSDFRYIQTAQLGDPAPPTELAGQLGGMWALPGDTSPVSYNLSWFPPDTFPTGFTRYVEDKDLARVSTTYRRQRSKTRATKVWVARDPAQRDSQGFGYAFPLPLTRTEFHNTDGVVWSADFEQWSYDHNAIVFETALTSGLADHQAGGSYAEEWNTAVFGPGLGLSDQQAYRTGDVLVFQIPLYADAAANHAGTSATTSARTVLTRDGTAVGESTVPGGGVFDVPASSAHYRLETTATRDVSELSTRQSAAWTFTSSTPPDEGGGGKGKGKGGTPLPLMTVRFAPPDLSALNRNGAKTAEVPVTVTHQPGAPVPTLQTLTVEQSVDDGTTWAAVPVTRTGDLTAVATVTHPRGGRFLSLRTTASDAAGNTVEQTIIRAYEI